MKRILLSLAIIALAPAAQAACFADYKAKQDNPLRLQYGVAQIADTPCTKAAAKRTLTLRLAAQGWTLLNVLGTFDETGLAERESNAGEHFLRY